MEDNYTNKKVEEIINSAENIERVKAPDFFLKKVMAGIERGGADATQPPSVRLWLRFAAVLALLVVNSFIMLNFLSTGNANSALNGSAYTAADEIIADYNLNTSQYYALETALDE